MDGDSTQDDGLKWFGEGFDGFPKRLPDDCMEYHIYVINEKYENNVSATRDRLNEILRTANALGKKYFQDFVWQRDSFELRIYPKSQLGPPHATDSAESPATSSPAPTTTRKLVARPHLRGRTNFGDSIADEWHIVYVLVEVSKQFPDAWIRMYDTDGEFLLIEGAAALPKWLNPEIAENRVWVNNGRIQIIPLEGAGDVDGSAQGPASKTTPGNLTLSNAVVSLANSKTHLLHIPDLDTAAFQRLSTYPSAISSSMHHAMVTLPRRLAAILHHGSSNARYISPAIEAFYLRDPISLRPLATKDLSTLVFAPEDFVTVSIRFSKVGYAQLRSQVFDPPPPAWIGVALKLRLAAAHDARDEKLAMGMKLTCGFEMLLADAKNRDRRIVQEMRVLLDDIESGEEPLPTDDEIASWRQTQDDEAWLDIDYAAFEKELAETRKGPDDENLDAGSGDAQENLHKLVAKFRDFMNDDEAGAEGIDDDDDDDDDDSDDDDEHNEDVKDEPSHGSNSPQLSSTTAPAPSHQPPIPSPNTHADDEEAEEEEEEEATFTQSIQETAHMAAPEREQSGLLAEARALAQQQEEADEAADDPLSTSLQALLALSKAELTPAGLIKRRRPAPSSAPPPPAKPSSKPFFGPPRPPHLDPRAPSPSPSASSSSSSSSSSFPIGFGPDELSDDDDDDDDAEEAAAAYNDVDLTFAQNLLESLKGPAGAAGPAGNLMRALGVGLPRDDGEGRGGEGEGEGDGVEGDGRR